MRLGLIRSRSRSLDRPCVPHLGFGRARSVLDQRSAGGPHASGPSESAKRQAQRAEGEMG